MRRKARRAKVPPPESSLNTEKKESEVNRWSVSDFLLESER